jgi:hypothetical protein
VLELPFGHCDPRAGIAPELGSVEFVAPGDCLGMDRAKIDVNCSARSTAGAEAQQLRMMAISNRSSAQDVSREERLAP